MVDMLDFFLSREIRRLKLIYCKRKILYILADKLTDKFKRSCLYLALTVELLVLYWASNLHDISSSETRKWLQMVCAGS